MIADAINVPIDVHLNFTTIDDARNTIADARKTTDDVFDFRGHNMIDDVFDLKTVSRNTFVFQWT